jgi:hypothetical protein
MSSQLIQKFFYFFSKIRSIQSSMKKDNLQKKKNCCHTMCKCGLDRPANFYRIFHVLPYIYGARHKLCFGSLYTAMSLAEDETLI